MAEPAAPTRFEGWEIRPAERLLLVRGRRAAVGSRAFDVLSTLVDERGRVVGKDELLDRAWPGLVVEENNLSVQIAALRKVLGTHAIATVPGLGYRLAAAPLQAAESEPAAGNAGAALVGRDRDVAQILDALGTRSLLTIAGPGGVGKTTLGKAVREEFASTGRPSWWVDLAPLRETGEVVPAIARALGVDLSGSADPERGLVSALPADDSLLVLDNCEHLVSTVAGIVARGMTAKRGLRWLATSQEPLRVTGEVVHRLAPLELPEPGTSLEACLGRGAMRLLCQLASAGDQRFAIDASNLNLAVDLCRQLEGLPLAIEMAAARLPTLGLAGVGAQLERRLHLPSGRRDAPPRQHTLQQTLDWSYGLLDGGERDLLRRLEPFLGGFTATMAADVSGRAEAEAIDTLSALVDKSLVQRSEAAGRFRLLESTRDYCRERALAAGESALDQRRHAEAVGRCFADAQANLQAMSDAAWAERYVPERHNLRAALAWARTDGEPDLLAVLVAGLAQVDTFTHSSSDVLLADVPLDRLSQAALPLRAAAYVEFAWVHYAEGSRETGTRLARQALEDYRTLDDTTGEYRALAQLVRLYESRPGHMAAAVEGWQALKLLDESSVPLRTRLACTINNGLHYAGTRSVGKLMQLESIAQASGFESLAALCKAHATDQLLVESRFEEAAELASRHVGAGSFGPRIDALLRHNLSLALVELDRPAEARVHAREASRMLPASAYIAVDTFALAAARGDRLERAAVLSGYAAQVRQGRDERSDPAEARAVAETQQRLETGLKPELLRELQALGAAMGADQALALALDF